MHRISLVAVYVAAPQLLRLLTETREVNYDWLLSHKTRMEIDTDRNSTDETFFLQEGVRRHKAPSRNNGSLHGKIRKMRLQETATDISKAFAGFVVAVGSHGHSLP